jgi:hypothetical protein
VGCPRESDTLASLERPGSRTLTATPPTLPHHRNHKRPLNAKGGCAFYIYDSTGKLYNSGSYTNAFDKPVVEVNPFASKGRFQTVGCTPRVMIKPLSPDW